MKFKPTYILSAIAALLGGVAMVSCTETEIVTDSDEMLPPGSHPLMLRASVEGLKSRTSAGVDIWNDGDEIGVRLINKNGRKYSIMARYSVNREGYIMDIGTRYGLDSDDNILWTDAVPLEWPYPTGTVTGWYPFEPQNSIDISDQTKIDTRNIDFMTAWEENKGYKEVVDLNYHHLMSKVTCKVIQDDGINDAEFNTHILEIFGTRTVSFSEKTFKVEGADNGWIKPYIDQEASAPKAIVYEALLMPQEISDQPLMHLDITVEYNGYEIDKSFSYPADGKYNLEAGKHYVYTIIVKKDRIVVSDLMAEWDDKGGIGPATPFTFRVNFDSQLSKNLADVLTFSDNVTPHIAAKGDPAGAGGDYLEVSGHSFTIDIPENLRDAFMLKTGDCDMTRDRYEDKNTYTYFIKTDEITLSYEAFTEIGDILYADGTWGPGNITDATAVGIVFYAGQHPSDNLSDYRLIARDAEGNPRTDSNGNPIEEQLLDKIHGYAVALKDMTTMSWGSFTVDICDQPDAYDGFLHRRKYDELNRTDKNAHQSAIDYGTSYPVQGRNSGWFLPSFKQLKDCYYNTLDIDGLYSYPSSGYTRYWSSTEETGNKVKALVLLTSGIAQEEYTAGTEHQGAIKTNSGYARPIIAF